MSDTSTRATRIAARRPALGLALGLAVGLMLGIAGPGCSSEGANTQVMVTIEAEQGVRGMSNSLVVRVYGGRREDLTGPSALVQEFPFPVSAEAGWPRVVALAPLDRDASRLYRVEASAYREGLPTRDSVPVATVRAISGYAEGQILHLHLVLQDSCIGTSCEDPASTCRDSECTPADVPVGSLPPWGVDAGVRMDATIGADGGRPDGGPVCDPAMCDDGLTCTYDFCMPDATCGHTLRSDMCDDDNVCTEDACTGAPGGDGSGCTRTPNEIDCSDGIFCNGADTCSAGVCVAGASPCGGGLSCDEAGDTCTGCSAAIPCPDPSDGAWGSCDYDSTCDRAASRSRTSTSFVCGAAATCIRTDVVMTEACSRTTENVVCGDSTYGAWTCGGFSDVCDETGTESRSRTDFLCTSGSCVSRIVPEARPCARGTDLAGCNDGNGCTTPDLCSGGSCMSGPNTCGVDAGGPVCMDSSDCSDGFSCTDDSCVGGGTSCSRMPDNSLCVPPKDCAVGTCQPASPLAEAFTGCVYSFSDCADGGSGECTIDAECEDGDVCTDDSCDTSIAPSACVHVLTECFDAGSDEEDAGIDAGRPPDGGSRFDSGPPCGSIGQMCCSGSICFSGTCIGGSCQFMLGPDSGTSACGSLGQMCCPGSPPFCIGALICDVDNDCAPPP